MAKTAEEQLNDSFDSLSRTAMRVKGERDALLLACLAAEEAIDSHYDVDQPEPGHFKEYPFSGAGEILRKLRAAIEKADGRP
jgi:hypothetical protein